MTSTPATLTALLGAVRDLQHFGLIEFTPDTNRVALTTNGAEAATVVKAAEIRTTAARLLGPGQQ